MGLNATQARKLGLGVDFLAQTAESCKKTWQVWAMQVMKQVGATMALLLLMGCDGNPFKPAPEPTPPPEPPPNNQPVVVPDVLLGDIQKVVYTPGATSADSTLQIQITGLDTTPLLATWTRNPDLDVPGYEAFSVQQDALDRMFVGLAATSADGSVSSVLAADGPQFNIQNSGSSYARAGAFDAPPTTGSGAGTGQVSYAGDYAGILNVGVNGAGLLPVPPGTDPTLVPTKPVQVAGKAFLNANFADNTVNGSVYDRIVVDTGFGLESIILIKNGITTNGTFEGTVQRPNSSDSFGETVGAYGGVFGGVDAAGVAGAVKLTKVSDVTGTELTNVTERGIFVLNQCGLAGVPVAPGCTGTAP